MKTVIYDLDGTLSDDRHRRYLVQGKYRDYDAYHKLAVEDDPVPQQVSNLANHLQCGDKYIIMTGRPDTHRDATILWLRNWGIEVPSLLFMRPAADKTPAAILKAGWVEKCIQNGYIFTTAYDDDARNIEVFRSMKIHAVKVRL